MKNKRKPIQVLIARLVRRSLPRIALACLPLALSAPLLASEETQKKVLVFYATRKEAPYPTLGEKILQKTLSEGLGGRLDYYSEYLDVARFSELDYQEALRDFLRRKYERWHPDLIIATSDRCIEFLQRYGASLFPGSPVVFIRDENESPFPNATGVSIKIDLKGTIDLALKLQPHTKRVFVISGASAYDKGFEDLARRQFQKFEGRITLTYLDGLPLADLQKTAANLPPDSIIYFLMLLEDGSGNRFLLADSVDKISAVANAPIYGWFDAAIDHGIVGGSLMSLEVVAQKTAEVGLRVLRGERPENIPVAELQIHFPMFDWRQLRRWGIEEQRLPPGSILLFKELSFWERYQKYILSGIAVIILQALLITGLLWQRAQKRSGSEAIKVLGGRQIHAQEQERARIARELHDDFSQRLAVQCIELEQLHKNLPESEAEERARALTMLKETKEMSADIRSLSHQLYSSRLELVGLVPALRGLCEETTKNHKITVRLTEPEFPLNLTKDVALCLFRVAQESLANTVKHSQASSAHIELGANGNGVSLRISDAGKGFDPDLKSAGAGIGLMSMRERLRLLGGRLSVHSELMRGTIVIAEIPLSAFANEAQAKAQKAGGMES